MNNNNNITLTNPFVWEKFFSKNTFDSIDEMQTAYAKFIAENKETVSRIDEMLENGDYQSINEEFGYDMSDEIGMINEAMLGKRRVAKPVEPVDSDLDGYAEDRPFSGVKPTKTAKPITTDDIEAAETAKKGVTIVKSVQPANTPVDVKVVRNVGWDSTSIHDIHFCVQSIYQKLIGHNKNYEVVTPMSLLDTEAIEEMDALFAFMDLPNIDISRFDTSNVTNMEGMFYKSTFDNDSIKNWDVSKVDNMRNMFIGSCVTNPAYISGWYPNTKNHALPKLGVNDSDDLDNENVIDNLFGTEEEVQQKYKDRMSYAYESWHVMSSSEFIGEGKIGDFVRNKAKQIQASIKELTMKLKNGMEYVFDKFGNMLNVITTNASVNYVNSKNIQGVTTGTDFSSESGYYDTIKKGDTEYDNYITFLKYASEKNNNVNEARVTMSANTSKIEGAAAPNIDAPDWNSAKLEHHIRKIVNLRQKHPGREQRPLVVWGAPGIGKSSIPKSIIRALNNEQGRENESDKMTVLVADCSQMTADGFALPTPAKQQDVETLIASNTEAARLAKESGMSIKDLQAIEYKVSDDAPKTWLPVYKPTGDMKKDEILNALANGAVQPIYDEEGYVTGYEKTGSGGILLIDEFLRANKQIFFIVCQLMFEGRYGEYVLGNKWQIIAASNRPSDDKEVRTKYADAAAAGFNRLARCNFVPSFDEWKVWAKSHGFDETILSFIAGEAFDGPNSRWHNFDPEMKNNQNAPAFASPRSWADTIAELQDECEFSGYSSYGEIPKQEFKDLVEIHLPSKLSQEFTDYYFINSNDANPYTYDNILKNPKLTVKNKSVYKCANVCDNLATTIRLRYNKKNPIPPKEFESMMQFLCKNYPADPNVIYANFYQEVFKSCNLSASENATQEEIDLENSYDKVGDIFAEAFPEFVDMLSEQE